MVRSVAVVTLLFLALSIAETANDYTTANGTSYSTIADNGTDSSINGTGSITVSNNNTIILSE